MILPFPMLATQDGRIVSDAALLDNPFVASIVRGNKASTLKRVQAVEDHLAELSNLSELTSLAGNSHVSNLTILHSQRAQETLSRLAEISRNMMGQNVDATRLLNRPILSGNLDTGSAIPLALMQAWRDYVADRAQRTVLFLDAMRERGDIFLEHEAAGCPPVLVYDYDVVMDGASLPQPCNYMLLRIRPPEGIEILPWKRPYIIVDPRAGQGAGIGGSQPDSQVGVALRDGHPVYFVSFRREPVPGQTLADVTRAEAAFVRYVQTQHAEAARPVVIGNCQGGWATLLLGASNPDITGPLVINGAPVETWSGEIGRNVMRYNAGLLGGEIQPMFWSDIGNGVFDGAWLVFNFEMLNPGRTWFRKYYDFFCTVDTERSRFLEFEKWWGGFFLLNEEEIVWIVRDLFVGNKLARNEARLERGRNIDVKQIRSPIIVFTSHGDTITPPGQALNWIIDTYADETEIRIRGQRIIYMVHEKVGHLGIFVSSSIARREHAEVSSTLKTIEALAPGLYEMVIEDTVGEGQNQQFRVSFIERRMTDLSGSGDGRRDEVPFAAVSRLSELQGDLYDALVRPLVQTVVTDAAAELSRKLHPLRVQRSLLSSQNPLLKPVEALAGTIANERMSAEADNPFVAMERLLGNMVEQSMDFVRDIRNAWYETTFFSIYATPYMRWFGRHYEFGRTRKSREELFALPEVQTALMHVNVGGYTEAVIRMLILLAESRGNVRRDRLERSAHLLNHTSPFEELGAAGRSRIIHEQSLIAQYAGEQAITSLPHLLHTDGVRAQAMETVQTVLGPVEEMEPRTLDLLQRFREAVGLPFLAAASSV